MNQNRVILITGGSRSGKSRFALEKMAAYPRKVFLATAVATDEEMKERIAQHRKDRGAGFVTVEEPIHLAEALRREADRADAILVDCLTFWLNNLFYASGEDVSRLSSASLREIEDFLRVLEESPTTLILVTNEINMGVISPEGFTRRFVDEQGRLNQEAARRADEVVLMVAGIPQTLKQTPSLQKDTVSQ